jgi:hypothetical protein
MIMNTMSRNTFKRLCSYGFLMWALVINFNNLSGQGCLVVTAPSGLTTLTVCQGATITIPCSASTSSGLPDSIRWFVSTTNTANSYSRIGNSSLYSGTYSTDSATSNLVITNVPLGLNNLYFRATAFENGCGLSPVNSGVVQLSVDPDNTPPTAGCQNINLDLNASGNATLSHTAINNNSADNCTPTANLTLAAAPTVFDCDNLGVNIVVLTATDRAGRSDTCQARVTVRDVTPPMVNSLVVPALADSTTS